MSEREEMLDAIRVVVREECEAAYHAAACPACNARLVCRPGDDPLVSCGSCEEVVVVVRIANTPFAFTKRELDEIDLDAELERLKALADDRRALKEHAARLAQQEDDT